MNKQAGLLSWAIIFLLIAIVSAILGFRILASVAGFIAKMIFVIFIILFIIYLIKHLSK